MRPGTITRLEPRWRVTAATYRSVGGIEPLRALEDAEFAERLARHDIPLLRPADVRVRTSARADGRVTRGLSVDLAVLSWLERRRYRATDFRIEALRRPQGRDDGRRDRARQGVRRDHVAGSSARPWGLWPAPAWSTSSGSSTPDRPTAPPQRAARSGARVLQQDEIAARSSAPRLARATRCGGRFRITSADIVCFLDADTSRPEPISPARPARAALTDDTVTLVKGAFERPLNTGAVTIPTKAAASPS